MWWWPWPAVTGVADCLSCPIRNQEDWPVCGSRSSVPSVSLQLGLHNHWSQQARTKGVNLTSPPRRRGSPFWHNVWLWECGFMKQAVKAEVLRRAKTSAAMNTAASSRSDKRVDFHLCVFGFCSTVDVVETNQNLRVCVVLASQQVTRHCGENKKHIIVISTLCVCVWFLMVVRSCLVSCNSPKRSPVFSLVCKVGVRRTWQPHPYIFIYSLPFSLSQAAAASWASGHTRPQPPSHIEHHPPSPKSLQLFFYTVTYSRSTGSALATHPPTPPWKVPGMHDKGAHTPFVHPLTASPV